MQVERVGDVLAGVGLVVADVQSFPLAEDLDQRHGDTGIAVPQHAQVPEPVLAAQRRCERMHREEQRLRSGAAKPCECLVDGVVVGPVKHLGARLLVRRREPDIAGNDDVVADLQNRLRIPGLAIEIDDQPRIGGEHRRRVQAVGQPLGELGGADVPGDVPGKRVGSQPQRTERAGDHPARMIADQQDRPRRLRLGQDERRRIIRTDERGAGRGGR